MGWPEVAGNGRKSQEQSCDHGGRRRRFVGPIRARPAVVGSEIFWRDRPEVAHLPVRSVYSNFRWWCLVWSDLSWLSNE